MSNRPLLPIALLPIGILVLQAPGMAQLIAPVSLRRSVDGFAEDCRVQESGHEEAADFGIFDAEVRVGGSSAVPSGAWAGQLSEVRPAGIVALAWGDTFLDPTCGSATGGCSYASACALFRLDFDLLADATYCLHGSLFGGYPSGDAAVALRDDQGDPLSVYVLPYYYGRFFDETGSLTAGRYTLDCSSDGGGGGVCFGQYYWGHGEFDLSFTVAEDPRSFCVSAPNSAGDGGASMGYSGSLCLEENDFALSVSGAPPSSVGLFFFGPERTQLAFGDGFRCVGGAIRRLHPPTSIDASGSATRPIDFDSGPAGDITALVPWAFQLWYRDPGPKGGGGGAGFNLSDGLQVVFLE